MKAFAAILTVLALGFMASPAAAQTACSFQGRPGTAAKWTVVSAAVSNGGATASFAIVSSSGDEAVDRASLACVRTWIADPQNPKNRYQLGLDRQFSLQWSATPQGVWTGHLVTAGRPHYCGDTYPQAAAASGASGTSKLRFTITADGFVSGPVIEQSSGNGDLDAAALQCVLAWRYKPATNKDGQPVAAPWAVNIVWQAPPKATP